ncbi:hypothetical protein [Arthrobacter sp. ISL-85]|uniref:baeRF2 domain-containing protein n=1 Tax=Arthrobacter sp. ISL-85 TaxID=2819115 RepID=UPI002034C110|nr:hypothetical protein [Arthrobacter sp. ISL-85]
MPATPEREPPADPFSRLPDGATVTGASGARLIVLAGDIRARGLVKDNRSEASKALVSEVDSHTHTAGSDSANLEDQVNRVAEVWAEEQQKRDGQAGGPGGTGQSGSRPRRRRGGARPAAGAGGHPDPR